MNERIKQLARECGLPTDSDRTLTHEVERFAELIVRECIIVCWPGGESDILYEQASAIDKAFIDGQDACVERLKQHFGVES